MRVRVACCVLAVSVALAMPAGASAAFIHVVAPGESLSSIAAADGLSVAQLAAANGLSPYAQLIAGQGVQIPPQGMTGAVAAAPVAAGEVSGDGDVDSDDGVASPVAVPSAIPSAGYVVQPGDTLSAIAARAGTTVAALAAANGLDPTALLVSGRVLHVTGLAAAVPVSSTIASSAQEPQGAAALGSPSDPPYPTPERLSASEVGSIGSANGVSASLADAIAWEESGFNNDLVSSTDARGIMQIEPGTWRWIQSSLNAGAPLAPASAADNVRGGSIMLNWLLNQSGGDPALAAAGYYQGLDSVRRNGMFPETQQYVQNVLALRARFGGP